MAKSKITFGRIILLALATFGIIQLVQKGSEVVVNNVVIGSSRVKNFQVLFNNVITNVSNLGDFIAAFQGVPFLQIPQAIESMRFILTVETPVTNHNPLPIPDNSFSGSLNIKGQPISDVVYPATSIPAGETVVMKSNINTGLDNVGNLFSIITTNPQSLVNDAAITGHFVSNGVSIPYSSPLKFF